MSFETTTCKFNVGGRLFEVQQSLVERFPETIIAKAATTHQEGDSRDDVLFFDRDSVRFAYILDYMRDGEVDLLSPTTKVALMKEFRFFGFENVDPSVIKISAPISDATELLLFHIDQHHKRLKEYDDTTLKAQNIIADAQKKKACSILAFICLQQFISTRKTGSFQLTESQWKDVYPGLIFQQQQPSFGQQTFIGGIQQPTSGRNLGTCGIQSKNDKLLHNACKELGIASVSVTHKGILFEMSVVSLNT